MAPVSVITLLILCRGTAAIAPQEEGAGSCSAPDCQERNLESPVDEENSLLTVANKVHRGVQNGQVRKHKGDKIHDSRSLLSVRSVPMSSVCGAFKGGGACTMPDGSKPYVNIGSGNLFECAQLCQKEDKPGCCWHSPKHNGCEFMAGGGHFHYGAASSRESTDCTTCGVTSNAAISGYNYQHLTGQTVKSCEVACDNASWCKSYDWYKNSGKCDLSDKCFDDVGGLKTDYSGNPYDHYSCSCTVHCRQTCDGYKLNDCLDWAKGAGQDPWICLPVGEQVGLGGSLFPMRLRCHSYAASLLQREEERSACDNDGLCCSTAQTASQCNSAIAVLAGCTWSNGACGPTAALVSTDETLVRKSADC